MTCFWIKYKISGLNNDFFVKRGGREEQISGVKLTRTVITRGDNTTASR